MSTIPDDPRRRHRRFNVDVEATVHYGRGQRVAARTRDLSRSGICLISASPIPSGAIVVIDLVLSFGSSTFSEPLHLDARVVWCTSIEQSFQIGAMFNELGREQTDFLDMFLRYLDGSLAPSGVQPEDREEDDRELTPPPDIKDDPFRR